MLCSKALIFPCEVDGFVVEEDLRNFSNAKTCPRLLGAKNAQKLIFCFTILYFGNCRNSPVLAGNGCILQSDISHPREDPIII